MALRRLRVRPRRVRWRYHFTDLRSGLLIATLPLRDVRVSDATNVPSDGAANLPLTLRIMRRSPFAATIPRRSAMWAERIELDPDSGRAVDSQIMWSGIVMRRSRKRFGRTMSLSLVTWASYFAHRLTTDATFTQIDKFTIFRALLAQAVVQPGGFIPPHLSTLTSGTTLSGVLADRTYSTSDLKPVLESATQLAASGDGFDWRLVPYRDTDAAATFRLRLDLGYPRLGRTRPPGIVWSSQQNDGRAGYLVDYTITEDGSAVSNRIVALGQGSGPTQLRSTINAGDVGRPEVSTYGYLLFESSLSSSSEDLSTQAVLDAHARGAMLAGLASETQLTGIVVRGDLAPTVTTYQVGDDGEFRIGDAVTGQPTTIVGQMIARTIEPSQQGRTEKVTMNVVGSVVG
jgi:hypothetical protein